MVNSSFKNQITSNLGSLHPRQRAWVEINRSAIEFNTRVLHKLIAPTSQLMAVVKADGYGHGALNAAESAQAGGASSYGVATLQEGVQLRQGGIQAPILVLGNLIQSEELRACHHWRLMPTISTIREALICETLGSGSGRIMPLHLKLDTGMTRLGVNWKEGSRIAKALSELKGIKIAGIYSHLAMADVSNKVETFTHLQKQRFLEVLNNLDNQNMNFGYRHLANSAGTLHDSGLHFDMVRVGLALYGQVPSSKLTSITNLKPALQLRARVTLIREVPSGVGVSYGHGHTTSIPSRLAVISIGYADGIPRVLSGQMQALFKGQRLQQVGKITMDQLILDCTSVKSLTVGSIVTLLGKSGKHQINTFDWSEKCNTIPWEILCGFKHRLPRLVLNTND
uniref:Alanine racemase n=1 Tax=Paulinella chromatophora TaxID=39717 RepID=B1X4X8_PAUCH|nr:alanine racemase [Paulinella chromatophora]ACB42997.1 alanine racemase [Paulinella chromatophora]